MYLVTETQFTHVGSGSISRFSKSELCYTQESVISTLESINVLDTEGNPISLDNLIKWFTNGKEPNFFVEACNTVNKIRDEVKKKPAGTVFKQVDIYRLRDDYPIVLFNRLTKTEAKFIQWDEVIKYELDTVHNVYTFLTKSGTVYRLDKKTDKMIDVQNIRFGITGLNSNIETLRQKVEFYELHKDKFIFIHSIYKLGDEYYVFEYSQFGKYMINLNSPIININGDALLIMRKIYTEQNIVAQDKRLAVTFNDLQSKFELV